MVRIEHIGLDVDGVLRDLALKLVQVFEREFPALSGRQLPIECWPEWSGFDRYFPEEANVRQLVRQFFDEIWLDAPVYPGVLDFYQQLAEQHTVHIVTAQLSPRGAELTREWLWRNGFDVPEARIHILQDKHQAPIELLVDDLGRNLQAMQDAGRLGVCLERPWNGIWSGPRIQALPELFPLLEQLMLDGEAASP